MKKSLLAAALLLTAAGTWSFYPKSTEASGSMMVISNLSLGLNAQASIIVVAPDGTQKEREVDFSRGSAKQLAANTTVVHKAALATINEYTRAGWHLIGTAPNGVTTGGNTIFSQTIYLLEK